MFRYLLFATFLVTLTYQSYVPLEELDVVTFRDNVTVCIPKDEHKDVGSHIRWSPITFFDFNAQNGKIYHFYDYSSGFMVPMFKCDNDKCEYVPVKDVRHCQQDSHSTPQLKCTDGTADCKTYAKKISHIDCHNTGIKNDKIDWQCKAEVDEYDPIVIDVIDISCRKVYDLKIQKNMIDINSCTLVYEINNDITTRKKTVYSTLKTDAPQFDSVKFCTFLFFIWFVSVLVVITIRHEIKKEIKKRKSTDCNKTDKKN